jgi:DNA-binding CsgD family transcriptional regulator
LVGFIALTESLFLAGLGATIVAFYSAAPSMPRGPAVSLGALEVALIVIQASIYAALFLTLGRIEKGGGFARLIRIAARVLSAINVLLPLAYLTVAVNALALRTERPSLGLGPFGFVLTGATVALSGLAFILADLRDEPPSLRFLARGLGCCCIGFIPLTLAEALLESSSSWPYKPVSLDSLFYLALNVVSCLALARSLFRDEGRAFSGVSDEKAASLGLTERERAMAEMIGRGLSNKEIASDLGISPATVRTHIYNLYRKTGAGSRVELLNKLAGR